MLTAINYATLSIMQRSGQAFVENFPDRYKKDEHLIINRNRMRMILRLQEHERSWTHLVITVRIISDNFQTHQFYELSDPLPYNT